MPDPSGNTPDLSAGFVTSESRARKPGADPIWWATDFDKLRARVSELEAKLQEGIDGGHRAKAELGERITYQADAFEKLTRRSLLAEGRLEKLEDKAGSIGEWQEAVDAQLNELFGRLLEIEGDPPPIVKENTPRMLRYIASKSSDLSGGEKDWLLKAAALLERPNG